MLEGKTARSHDISSCSVRRGAVERRRVSIHVDGPKRTFRTSKSAADVGAPNIFF
jgi:hypothetical protein